MSAEEHTFITRSKSEAQEEYRKIDWDAREWMTTVIPYDPERSEGQRALIHVIMHKIAVSAGVHPEIFKQNWIKHDTKGIFPHWPKWEGWDGDKMIMMPKSERDLGRKGESEVIDRLHQLAAEWGVEL